MIYSTNKFFKNSKLTRKWVYRQIPFQINLSLNYIVPRWIWLIINLTRYATFAQPHHN